MPELPESILLPPPYERPERPVTPQTEPALSVRDLPARVPGRDGGILNVSVKEYTFTFSTVPLCYEDLVQYRLDSPYKAMALLFLAFRVWTPQNKRDCLEMLDYLTNTNVFSGKRDAQGRQLAKRASEHQFWTDFVRDRMMQNEKYRFIGSAYLRGAAPENGYAPSLPLTVTVRQSVYEPYKAATPTTPELRQVLVSLPGADSERYCLFYQDQRGDWRVWSDNWKGLLADVKPVI